MQVDQNCDTDNDHAALDQCIINITKNEGYITCEITKKQLPKDGGNYLGIIYEVDVKGETHDGSKTTAIFVKEIPANSVDIGLCLDELYKTEKFVYYELSKLFEEMQIASAIPEQERYKITKSYDEAHPTAIFLDNIARKGFKTLYRMDVVTLDYAEECIKQLARFHGLSFAIKVKRPNYFNNVLKQCKFGSKPGKNQKEFFDNVTSIVLEQLDLCVRERLEDDLRKTMSKYMEYVGDEQSFYCFCHGDYRPSNIMYKETNGKVTEVVPVDYQFAYYGCPVLDIIYFIYTGTDHQFRNDHLPYLKELYYGTLTQYLNYFNIPVNSVFPKNRYEELYESRKDFGLTITMFLGPFQFASEEDKKVDFTNTKSNQWNLVVDEKYKVRLHGAIKEFFVM